MNKIKMLLVHPEISHSKYNFDGVIENEVLELEYIVSVLNDAKINNSIFDVQRENIKLETKIEGYKPDIVYICGRIKQENFIKEHAKTIKKINPNIKVVVGGLHAQRNYDSFFVDDVDYVLMSFNIFKLLDIIEYEFGSRKSNLADIKDICFKTSNKWFTNEVEPFDINKLPHPNRDYFYNNLDHYRYLELSPCAQVRTSYCCPFKCNFCYRNLLNNGKYVYRDINDVVSEIESIKCDNIYFIDDDFLVNPKRLKEFVRLVKEKNINKRYVCFGRVDFIINHKELIKDLKDIGFYYILVGLEATSDDKLDSYNKLISVSDNEECVKFLNEIGINTMGLFITDLDYKYKDFKKIYKWIINNNLKHAAISIFTPIKGTKAYSLYKDKIITDNPEYYDYLHVVCKPINITIRRYYLYYYFLLIRLAFYSKRLGIYDFIDYKYYIKNFIKSFFTKKNK